MNQILALFTAAAFLFILSCNSTDDVSDKMASASFKLIMIQHPVSDFQSWIPVYNAHDSLRKLYGLSDYAIGIGTDDPTMVVVFNKITDENKAKEFAALPALKVAMDKAGVTGNPTIQYMNVVRNDTTKIEQKERVMVAHRVKDFDTWLKIFDEEGMSKRKEFGLLDRGLSRVIDDPNMVYIVFAITDKEKVKARFNSEELKKIMTDAGVEGPPQFMYFSLPE